MQNREENGSGKMVDVGIVFQKMLMLLVMMSIGFLAGKTRVMSVESNHMLSLLINKITMPCLVVYSSVCNAHSMSNRELLILLGIYFVSFALMIVVARLFRLLVSPERGHAGIYELLLIFPNSAFIGIPVASAIYGESAVFYLSMYNLPFYVALYCYGVNLIQDTPVRKIDFHQMLSPLMIASLLGVALYLCDVRLPALLTDDARRLHALHRAGEGHSPQLAASGADGGKACDCARDCAASAWAVCPQRGDARYCHTDGCHAVRLYFEPSCRTV